MVAEQLQAFLDEVNFLNHFQCVFIVYVSDYGTEITLGALVGDLCWELHRGNVILLILLDLISSFQYH